MVRGLGSFMLAACNGLCSLQPRRCHPLPHANTKPSLPARAGPGQTAKPLSVFPLVSDSTLCSRRVP